jgi:sulfite exporter TauE/SafE
VSAVASFAVDPAALAGALLLMGLGGSVTHCIGMCGPFVVAQAGAVAAARAGKGPGMLARLRGASLLPYQLGRATTYAALGAASAGLVGFVANLPGFRILAALLLCLAAASMLARAVGRSLPLLDRIASRVLPSAPPQVARDLMADPRGWRGYALGVVLGFLPCGLLWGALAAAGGAGGAGAGALAMGAFTLGTLPALVGVGYAGALFGRRFRPALAWATPAILLLNAVTLGALAVRALA